MGGGGAAHRYARATVERLAMRIAMRRRADRPCRDGSLQNFMHISHIEGGFQTRTRMIEEGGTPDGI